MWIENPFLIAISSIMVLLLVLAWLLPNQKWLDPFRAPYVPRRAPTADESVPTPVFPTARAAAHPPMTAVSARMADRQRAHRRMSRLYAGVSIIGAGLLIPFGHAALARMTANDPDTAPLKGLATTLAGLFVLIGLVVLFARDRHR